jgi:hypothetical protein
MILAKAIDGLTFSANLANGDIPFLNIGFTQYENYDTEENTWDSLMTYNAQCPFVDLSWNSIINTDAETFDFLSITMSKTTFNFARGEYFELNGDPLNLANIQSSLIGILF